MKKVCSGGKRFALERELTSRSETTNEAELSTASQSAHRLEITSTRLRREKKKYSGGKYLVLRWEHTNSAETTNEAELPTASQSSLGWKLQPLDCAKENTPWAHTPSTGIYKRKTAP